MNKRMNRTQRNYIIVGLCAILLIMVVGYAAFQSQLKISGTSNITSNFLVKITDIQVSSKSGGAADKSDVTKVTSDTSATFGTTLQSPGDSITYDITIENQGTIDAVLKTINKTDASNSAIIFETSGVTEGDELPHGETATMKVTVTYNPSVTSQPTNLESTLNVTLDYEQTEGIDTPPTPSGVTPADLKALAVTSGDGLYADEYESGKYTYKGVNPNNYITFNNETWRIISISPDGSIKIIRNESIGNMVFDTTGGTYGSNNWDRPADLNTYLNYTYLPAITIDQDKIVSHTWSMGEIMDDNDSNLAGQIVDENRTQSQSYSVGMITVSEYLRANTNIEQCGNLKLNNQNWLTCLTTDWMYNVIPTDGYIWTITPTGWDGTFLLTPGNGGSHAGYVGVARALADNGGVSPVLYLKSDITLTGDGSQGNPYAIS